MTQPQVAFVIDYIPVAAYPGYHGIVVSDIELWAVDAIDVAG